MKIKQSRFQRGLSWPAAGPGNVLIERVHVENPDEVYAAAVLTTMSPALARSEADVHIPIHASAMPLVAGRASLYCVFTAPR